MPRSSGLSSTSSKGSMPQFYHESKEGRAAQRRGCARKIKRPVGRERLRERAQEKQAARLELSRRAGSQNAEAIRVDSAARLTEAASAKAPRWDPDPTRALRRPCAGRPAGLPSRPCPFRPPLFSGRSSVECRQG